jgi:hypothetical protein
MSKYLSPSRHKYDSCPIYSKYGLKEAPEFVFFSWPSDIYNYWHEQSEHTRLTAYLPSYLLSANNTITMAIGEKLVEAFCSIEYDYVIIGGGTAGLVLAARLSENESINVGVLEAGELRQDDPSISTPLLSSSLQGDPNYDWMFKTVPQVCPLCLIPLHSFQCFAIHQ